MTNISVTGAFKCCQDCESNCQSYGFHFNDYYDASDIKTINAKLNGYQCNTQWYQDYGTWEIVVVPSKDNFELLGKPTYMECKK